MLADSSRPLDVTLFAHLVYRPDFEVDLGQAALLIAEPEYPDLNIAEYLLELDKLAVGAKLKLAGLSAGLARGVALVQHLLEDEGFRGNVTDYDDPRNSFINEVLDRRLGIPITLSVVMLEVARRLDVPLRGVSFPGHFLICAEGPQSLLLDPFTGQTLNTNNLADLLGRVYGQRRPPRPEEVQLASKHSILARMLQNLRNLYMRQGDLSRQRLAEERLQVVEAAMRAMSGADSSSAASRSSLIH